MIAEVAQKFDLYTKITGGQRIDLFGARVEQLPEIWGAGRRRLRVRARVRQGAAHGQVLRRLDWCRFGAQDSVDGDRPRAALPGLRSPHKLKMGVSGCARECAEARARTSASSPPRTAGTCTSAATAACAAARGSAGRDLDDETLIRYIDRFLMFYIRTADRLQRTAPGWSRSRAASTTCARSSCDDSLGLAAELEAAMARHVGDYACEWKGDLDDPDRLTRFLSFVNAPDVADPTISNSPNATAARCRSACRVPGTCRQGARS